MPATAAAAPGGFPFGGALSGLAQRFGNIDTTTPAWEKFRQMQNPFLAMQGGPQGRMPPGLQMLLQRQQGLLAPQGRPGQLPQGQLPPEILGLLQERFGGGATSPASWRMGTMTTPNVPWWQRGSV
jgi:hypothetical protein